MRIFSTIAHQSFVVCATLLALCCLRPAAEAESQLVPLLPSEGTVFGACDAFSPPSFRWESGETYKSLEIQFLPQNSSKTVKAKIPPSSGKVIQLIPSVWKKVFLLPGSAGGAVYWKIIGTRVDRTKVESNPLSFHQSI